MIFFTRVSIRKKPMRKTLLFILSLAIGAGCVPGVPVNTVSSIEKESADLGATRNFPEESGSVANAAKSAVTAVGLKLVSAKPSAGGGETIFAQRGATDWSWGEVVRIQVMPFSGKTSVRILSAPAVASNITAKNFTEDLFTKIGQLLGENQ